MGMIGLDKIKAFFKWTKLAEKKAAEPLETKAPEKKGDESSSK